MRRHIDHVLLMERRLSKDKCFDMHKGDVVELPPGLFQAGSDAFIGLGWTCSRYV